LKTEKTSKYPSLHNLPHSYANFHIKLLQYSSSSNACIKTRLISNSIQLKQKNEVKPQNTIHISNWTKLWHQTHHKDTAIGFHRKELDIQFNTIKKNEVKPQNTIHISNWSKLWHQTHHKDTAIGFHRKELDIQFNTIKAKWSKTTKYNTYF
jgi:hypothetical protein